MLGRKFRALKVCIRRFKKKLSYQPKQLEKDDQIKSQEVEERKYFKIRTDIHEIENRKAIEKINSITSNYI